VGEVQGDDGMNYNEAMKLQKNGVVPASRKVEKQQLESVSYYMSQIPHLKYKIMPVWMWDEVMEMEALDEEFNRPLRSQWSYAELKITPLDKKELVTGKGEVEYRFDTFDHYLKKKYKMHLIDVIDREKGHVYILRWR
jgi:hypothetical protein